MSTDTEKTSTEAPLNLPVMNTLMAADRTLMSWTRTSLSLLSFGFTIFKILQAFQDTEGKSSIRSDVPRDAGLFLTAMGTFAMVMGTLEYWQTLKVTPSAADIRTPAGAPYHGHDHVGLRCIVVREHPLEDCCEATGAHGRGTSSGWSRTVRRGSIGAVTLDDMWTRVGEQLMARVTGPMHFRVYMQPAMAAVFAVISGLRDAKKAKAPYFWTLLHRPGERMEALKTAGTAWRVFKSWPSFSMRLPVMYCISSTWGRRSSSRSFWRSCLTSYCGELSRDWRAGGWAAGAPAASRRKQGSRRSCAIPACDPRGKRGLCPK